MRYICEKYVYKMKDRLRRLIEAENITQAQFADRIGMTRASISHILAGRNNPGYDFFANVAKYYPNVSIEWLFNGEGRMYKNAETADMPKETPVAGKPGELFPTEKYTEIAPAVQPVAEITPEIPVTNPAEKKIKSIIILFNDGTYQVK